MRRPVIESKTNAPIGEQQEIVLRNMVSPSEEPLAKGPFVTPSARKTNEHVVPMTLVNLPLIDESNKDETATGTSGSPR